jgi:glycosyltransferase involved in cell wall biosynthesis
MVVQMPSRGDPHIAVLIPCHNEARSVGDVVRDFRRALPTSQIYVYDNNSSDDTVGIARAAGAIVRSERYQGKGNVVRRMFADIVADIYVMVDGDGTYDAKAAPTLVQELIDHDLDLVCGIRRPIEVDAFRAGHKFGNRALTGLVRLIFGHGFRDMLTGYRVFSHRFVKTFPGASRGFEIETELAVHALQMRLPIAEIETDYGRRIEGSKSKLNTIRDGILIFQMIGLLVKEEKPFAFFSVLAFLFALTGLVIFAPVLAEYLRTGLVPRFPTLVVAVGAGVLAALLFACGLILDTVSRARRESRRLAYLNASMIAPSLWSMESRRGEGSSPEGASHLPEGSSDG